MFTRIKNWAKKTKKQIYVLFLAYKDKRVPWYARIFAACVVAYAFSPIDLIPDFIPILGYLDDVVIIPLGILLALKMLPDNVMTECTQKAEEVLKNGKPKNWTAGIIIIFLWCLILFWVIVQFF
ncbi:DUF1232 domain-containing protein [Bacillaceae bacterium Marseille-Q3522]|nr:DUF1232 domain-containing protein [Bacillaceae bacterium Marseille-Q3522]